MGADERRGIDNAVWLCSICHTNVDRNPDRFDATLLRTWKKKAERSAQAELGQRLPNPADAQNLLLAALTRAPTHLSRNAIANVIGATELQLQALDPRFLVRAAYANGVSTYTIEAIEPVGLSFKAKELAPDTLASVRSMYEHGTPVTMAANQLTVDGSPLMSHIAELAAAEGGTLTMTPREVPALLKLKLIEPNTNQVSAFDDMQGSVRVGRKSFTFEGTNCAGMLKVSFRKPLDDGATLTDGQFWADFTRWNGRDIRSLPYLDKLAKLYKMLSEGWQLEFALEMQGQELLRGHFNGTDSLNGSIGAMNTLLAYSMRARAIATHMNEAIAFCSDVAFTKDEHRGIGDAVEIFELRRFHGRADQIGNARCRLTPTDAALSSLLEKGSTPTEVIIRNDDRQLVKVFNQLVQLPPVEIWLKAVTLKILGDKRRRTRQLNDQTNQEKRELRVEFVPTDDYQCMMRYSQRETAF